MRNIQFLIFVAVLGVIISCNKSPEVESRESDSINEKQVLKESTFNDIYFTPEEQEYIKRIQEKGFFYIAAQEMNQPGVSRLYPEGNYYYRLTKTFAEYLGVDLKVKTITFRDVFSINGEIPESLGIDNNLAYTPDLFNEVEVLPDNVTILPWRVNIFRFVKILKSKVMIITRKGEEITKVEDLVGKRIGTVVNSSFHEIFLQIERDLDFDLTIKLGENFEDWLIAVDENRADIAAYDSNSVFPRLRRFPGLSVSLAISDYQEIGWVVNRDNRVLQSILQKYIDFSFETDLFNKLWFEDNGISLNEYYDLLEY